MKKHKLYKDFMLTLIAQLFILITNFLINKIISMNFGVSEFGIFNIIRRSATLLGFIVLSGQGIAITRYLAMSKDKNQEKSKFYSSLLIIMLLCLITTLIILVFPKLFLAILVPNSHNNHLLYIIIFFSLGISITTFIFSVFRGQNKFFMYSFLQMLLQLLVLLVVFYSLHSNYKTEKLLLNWGAINIGMSIILLCIIGGGYRKYKLNKNNFGSDVKQLFIYGAPRIVGEFVQFSYYLLPLVFVNNKFGSYESGLFSASTGILQTFLPFFSYIGLILLPKVSKDISENKFTQTKQKINKIMILYSIFSILIVVLASLFSKTILHLLYSAEYQEASIVANILLFSIVPRSIFLLLRNPIEAISKKPYNTYNLSISFVIMTLLMIFSNNVYFIAFSFVASDFILLGLTIYIWIKSEKIISKELKE